MGRPLRHQDWKNPTSKSKTKLTRNSGEVSAECALAISYGGKKGVIKSGLSSKHHPDQSKIARELFQTAQKFMDWIRHNIIDTFLSDKARLEVSLLHLKAGGRMKQTVNRAPLKMHFSRDCRVSSVLESSCTLCTLRFSAGCFLALTEKLLFLEVPNRQWKVENEGEIYVGFDPLVEVNLTIDVLDVIISKIKKAKKLHDGLKKMKEERDSGLSANIGIPMTFKGGIAPGFKVVFKADSAPTVEAYNDSKLNLKIVAKVSASYKFRMEFKAVNVTGEARAQAEAAALTNAELKTQARVEGETIIIGYQAVFGGLRLEWSYLLKAEVEVDILFGKKKLSNTTDEKGEIILVDQYSYPKDGYKETAMYVADGWNELRIDVGPIKDLQRLTPGTLLRTEIKVFDWSDEWTRHPIARLEIDRLGANAEFGKNCTLSESRLT